MDSRLSVYWLVRLRFLLLYFHFIFQVRKDCERGSNFTHNCFAVFPLFCRWSVWWNWWIFLVFSIKVNGDAVLVHWINLMDMLGVCIVISEQLFWLHILKILVRLVGSYKETPGSAYMCWFLIENWFGYIYIIVIIYNFLVKVIWIIRGIAQTMLYPVMGLWMMMVHLHCLQLMFTLIGIQSKVSFSGNHSISHCNRCLPCSVFPNLKKRPLVNTI